ncbi:MAG: hypothetical protein LKH27_05775 [Prevotella sp.]|jgi:hypothetical protein|nr:MULTISPECIES: hypothetical protein [unclassified Prevotella]MCH3970118.1 hypothetical protein [Prevotella sp.]MCH3984845.1 hypothetical protein [Prevotella sp.]MCH3992528.1 hypothetical protein [Prevotella sp.]MCH4016882.1 hypothetical protein [Prevotella sp.]MCH4099078.1 hypothetical protein [Prevotella sp.]
MKKNKNIAAFYLKCLALATPFILLIIIYMVKDPFMVVRNYHDYDHDPVCQNEGEVSWMKYKEYRHQMHYDSFIIGASCTKAFPCNIWNKYIHAHPYRMYSNSVGLGDLSMMLEALNEQSGQPIKHLLIITEVPMFANDAPKNDFMHIMPPDVSHKSLITYQTTFLQGFFTPKFLIPYIKYLIAGKFTEQERGIINDYVPECTRYTNDAILPQEKRISQCGENYWRQKFWQKAMDRHYRPTLEPPMISSIQIHNFRMIKSICQRHHTDLKLVISPNFKEQMMNPKDLAILHSIFGPNVVYNYADRKHLRMDNYHNFYDPYHYRISVGREIMREIYHQR